jgi:hypothetical protein
MRFCWMAFGSGLKVQAKALHDKAYQDLLQKK